MIPWRALRRPRAFWISVCNLIGLGFSAAGVLLLFYFALPNEPPGGPNLMAGGGSRPDWEAQKRLYAWYAHWGLRFVLLGTVLEAVPPFCTAIGSWRRRTQLPQQSTPAPSRSGDAVPRVSSPSYPRRTRARRRR